MSLQSLAAQHRQAILARERAAGAQIASQYQTVWLRLQARLQKLFDQQQAAERQADANDQPFDATIWWAQFHRLDLLLASVQADFGTFADAAMKIVRDHAGIAIKAGADDALALLENRLSKVDLVFGRPSEEALRVLANRGASNVSIADLFARMDNQAKDIVRKRLLSGLALGQSPVQVARDLRDGLKMPLNRALTISRTEMMNSYRTAALYSYRANSDVVEQWEWLAEPDACPYCSEMNGTKHSLDEGMETHNNCRCTELPVVKSYAALGYPDLSDDYEEAA